MINIGDRPILWHIMKTYPDGQPRRCLYISKARKEFGFKAKTKLEDGLRRAIVWFKKTEESLNL